MKRFLRKHACVSIDTSVLIYFVERHPLYGTVCESIFQAIEASKVIASTSTVSLLEILVKPYRQELDELALKFYSLLTTYPNLSWIDLTVEVADRAARLRAEYRLKTPDAIQLASALYSGSTGFICNDSAFRRVKEIQCVVLDDYVSKDEDGQ